MAALGGGLKAGAGMGAPALAPLSIGPADYKAFEQTLVEINAAWSKRDLAALARDRDAEMVSYFAQDMRDLEARNWRNETRDVRLEQGDLSEAGPRTARSMRPSRCASRCSTRPSTTRPTRWSRAARRNAQMATELWTSSAGAGRALVALGDPADELSHRRARARGPKRPLSRLCEGGGGFLWPLEEGADRRQRRCRRFLLRYMPKPGEFDMRGARQHGQPVPRHGRRG